MIDESTGRRASLDRGRVAVFGDRRPTMGRGVFLAQGSVVVGDVTLGDDVSLWFNAVLRGDVHSIRVGSRTNIQDLTMGHVTSGRYPLVVGEDVTVGHRTVLHGCTIGDRVLIGMGAVVLDGAEIADDSIIGAGSLVSPGTRIPSGVLALGSPARVVRELTEGEREGLLASAVHYVDLARSYMSSAGGRDGE